MTARSYIRDNVDDPYQTKLLSATDSYLRWVRKTNFHEYAVSDLAGEIDTIAKQRGVGQVTIQHLRDALKADGYL